MTWLCLDWRKSFLICISWFLGGGVASALPATSNQTLSNDCSGLLPDVIGDPRARSFPFSEYSDCYIDPTSSGAGVLALGVGNAFGPDRYWLYDQNDTELGQFQITPFNYGLYPTMDVFQQFTFRADLNPDPKVLTWSERGELISAQYLDPEQRDSVSSRWSVTSDVVEGGVFVGYERYREGIGWQFEAWRFNGLGNLLFGPIVIDSGPPQPPPWLFFTAGIDVNQNNLLAYQRSDSGPLSAIWFDLAGETMTTREFQIGDSLYNYRGLLPLLDRSFVLRRQGGGSLRVPAWDEEGDIQPAPQWIEDHPLTNLYFIRGMRGYALAPARFYGEGCEHEVSIFAPDGTYCGSFAPEPAKSCFPMAIGKDGTFFRASNEVLPCGAEECGCTQHYWVGLLR